MPQLRQQYEDRIRSRLGDLGVLQRLGDAPIELALEAAVDQYGNDNPRKREETFAGNGTLFDFGINTAGATIDDFIRDWSRIVTVEFPTGTRIPDYIETRRTVVLFPADVATFRMLVDTPATGQSVALTYTVRWPYPTDTVADDKIIDVHFAPVAALAASKMAGNKAAEFARQQSSQLDGDLFRHETEPLWRAKSILEAEYREIVLGVPPPDVEGTGSEPALITERVDVFPTAIFHRH